MARIDYSFGYKNTWFAIKSTELNAILSIYPKLSNIYRTTWEKGMLVIENAHSRIFLSGAYAGWSFLLSKGLCDPSQTEDIITLLFKFGEIAEEVCYFSSHRTVEMYGFAKVSHGKLIRLFCYSGEKGCIYKNIGEKTEAEKKLLLNLATNEDELFEEGFNEIDEDDILRLAGKLSLSPE